MKKKIAVVFNRMVVGGAEKALINFLKAIDTDKYDVTLFTFNDKGAYFEEIPSKIRVCFTECPDAKQMLLDDIIHFRFRNIVRGLLLRIKMRLIKNEYQKYGCMMQLQPVYKEKFDCAISYKLNYPDTATVIWRINASRKCAIMHSSVNSADNWVNGLQLMTSLLDGIFCVSEDCMKQLISCCPSCRNKTAVLHNVVNTSEIIAKGTEYTPWNDDICTITTVGRLSPEKGQQMIPQTVRMLLDAGYDIRWYLVGDGPLREEIEQEIRKYDVSDRVILLGTKTNPYPYIKNCKIYVQPSFSEGYCTTTMEAKVLCKPVVTTDAPGMREQFVSGENGLIVDAMTPEALFEGIRTLLDHPELCRKFEEKLRQESFDDAANAKELQKLYDFIES